MLACEVHVGTVRAQVNSLEIEPKYMYLYLRL